MKKLIISCLIAILLVTTIPLVSEAATYMKTFCPSSSGLNGWWAKFYPSNRLCSVDYYTWNTTTWSVRESWYEAGPLAVGCNINSWETVTFPLRAYIPSPHYSQTRNAHYHKWNGGTLYTLIGVIDQYNTYGWATRSSIAWNAWDRWYLSDFTGEAKYSKSVDLDAFQLGCPRPW